MMSEHTTSTEHLEGAPVTYGESLAPAMKITEQEDADNYLSVLIRYQEREGKVDHAEATRITKINLGYFSGYYNAETATRVNRLFNTTHPIFGDRRPTPEEALEAGRKFAEESKT